MYQKHLIADRKLKTVTAEHLQSFPQSFLDSILTFGGEFPDGKVRKGYSKRLYPFILQCYSSHSVLQYFKIINQFQSDAIYQAEKTGREVDLFSDDEVEEGTQPISHEDYERLIKYLERKPTCHSADSDGVLCRLRIGENVVLYGRTLTLRNNARL